MIEVKLPSEIVKEIMAFGRRRNEHNILMGKSHRHQGMEGGRAHGIGSLGEKAFRMVLEVNGIEYTAAPEMEDDPRKWKQDITIEGLTYGAKTKYAATYPDTFKSRGRPEPYFYYPAKDQQGEKKRVLGYPDFIISCSANPETDQVWLFAWISGAEARRTEHRDKGGFPAHHILWSQLHPFEELGIFQNKPIKIPYDETKTGSLFDTPYYKRIRSMTDAEYYADLVQRQKKLIDER